MISPSARSGSGSGFGVAVSSTHAGVGPPRNPTDSNVAGRDSAQESLPGIPSPANQQGASDESTLNHNVDHSGASLNNDRDAASLGGAHSNIPNGNGNAGIPWMPSTAALLAAASPQPKLAAPPTPPL